MRHILSILIENEAGALSRVVGLFSARGYNIDSLTVSTTEDATLSRMTIVTHGSDDVIEQITKQLNKLIEVVKVIDLNESDHIEREMMLIKVRATGKDREEMKRMADIFRGRIIDVTEKNLYHRTHRHQRKTRRLYRSTRPHRDFRNRAHRCLGYWSWRAHFENLRHTIALSYPLNTWDVAPTLCAPHPALEIA